MPGLQKLDKILREVIGGKENDIGTYPTSWEATVVEVAKDLSKTQNGHQTRKSDEFEGAMGGRLDAACL